MTGLSKGGSSQAKLIAPIAQLGWNSLHHPPLSYLGNDVLYRTADGRKNVYLYHLLSDYRISSIRMLEKLEHAMQKALNRLVSTAHFALLRPFYLIVCRFWL
jgi:hypothetical protein